jgi:hypothetical protein
MSNKEPNEAEITEVLDLCYDNKIDFYSAKKRITTLLELEYKKGYSDGTRDYAKTLENLALEGDK